MDTDKRQFFHYKSEHSHVSTCSEETLDFSGKSNPYSHLFNTCHSGLLLPHTVCHKWISMRCKWAHIRSAVMLRHMFCIREGMWEGKAREGCVSVACGAFGSSTVALVATGAQRSMIIPDPLHRSEGPYQSNPYQRPMASPGSRCLRDTVWLSGWLASLSSAWSKVLRPDSGDN